MNTAYNKATHRTPFELVHGYTPQFLENAVREVNLHWNDLTRPDRVQDKARDDIFAQQVKTKLQYDRSRYDRTLSPNLSFPKSCHNSYLPRALDLAPPYRFILAFRRLVVLFLATMTIPDFR